MLRAPPHTTLLDIHILYHEMIYTYTYIYIYIYVSLSSGSFVLTSAAPWFVAYSQDLPPGLPGKPRNGWLERAHLARGSAARRLARQGHHHGAAALDDPLAVLHRGRTGNGYGSKVNHQVKPQVLVHVSTY